MKPRAENGSEDVNSDLEVGSAALNWAVNAGSASRIADRSRLQARRNRRRRLVAASLGFCLVIALTAALTLPRYPRNESSIRSSIVIASPTTRILSDGTVVKLRDSAQIATDFGPTARRVTLKQGEAYFEVAHNSERPFIVAVNGIDVRAVGTAFVVHLGSDAIEVIVTEGRVKLDHPSSNLESTSAALAEIESGKMITVPTNSLSRDENLTPEIRAVSDPEVKQRLAWRTPQIEFSGTPLAEVVIWFNRYSPIRLILGDSSIEGIRLSGVLRPDNPDSLLRVLRNDFGIEAERQDDNRIVLLRR